MEKQRGFPFACLNFLEQAFYLIDVMNLADQRLELLHRGNKGIIVKAGYNGEGFQKIPHSFNPDAQDMQLANFRYAVYRGDFAAKIFDCYRQHLLHMGFCF